MLTPAFLASAADDVVEIYSQVEEDIVTDIARRILKTNYITPTAQWQLMKAKEFGYLQGDVTKILADATKKSDKEVKALMKEAGAKSLAYDDKIYKAAGLMPTALEESPALSALMLQGASTTGQLIGNFTHTTATTSTIAYNRLLDQTFIQILSGAFDPYTAIKRAIQTLATQGIGKIAYPSGSTTSLEASVRRAVTTGINQATAKLQLARMKELGSQLVQVSSHSGARPSHAEWQGGVYCLEGRQGRYDNFYDVTGYGTGDGLCGWNCYHSFYPFFEGLSIDTYSRDPSADEGRSNLEDYQNQMKQRYYERRIRAAKKECVVYHESMKAAKDEQLSKDFYAMFQRSSVKLKNREAALNEFLQATGRTRFREREFVGKFSRSISSSAVWANKKARR